ncbi:16S rRNA (guanine(527)-N(7))-methyltransferase RsmG [Tepidanaerobacter sp. GT38]|uniref:16S rRNA (guanine(527)-N(7))-methyltransferase RsmG n=1 Tax=Tepidanaerobacter sp. GT38 TaxID=2722793 RepID=UPI001F01D674|nr:16S rRNA (guanine(527)-N(7))-methyltransferase RsmG [Tepidanaerobacter sp. GT38]MCG1011709.1 16S rRNA (guanine(527)-N(7))-methyltransferase RsmG [Tepidanaerobacter sp. GT38]
MNAFVDCLKEQAEKHRILLTADNIRQFDYFKTQLLQWNKKTNLTNITEPEDFAIRHVIDSLMLCKLGDIKKGARLIDVGTGPGIPGLIVKLYRPDVKLTLLESVGKKTMFLKWIVDDMNLPDVEVINERAEAVAHNSRYRESFDVATARAVSALNTLSELCLPFVKVGGTFIAMKGKSPEAELHMAKKAIEVLGGTVKDCRAYLLQEDLPRSLIFISKVSECPEKYPRRPGIPEKRPL